MGNSPTITFRTAAQPGLEISAWEGDKGKISFVVTKSYKAQTGWKRTTTLYPPDLLALSHLCRTALMWADKKRADWKAEQKKAAAPPPDGDVWPEEPPVPEGTDLPY